ncbi:MAG: hydroxysqualene dehydroxylase HpnE [Rubripirellula sp.]|nr:hydroxysqualene dehydroxylase HpnE [Rubripirellula sp.]
MNEINETPRKRIVVVGGGLAGLSAAEALADAYPNHFQITVLEAKQTVGGRAGSFTDPATGETVDYCQHVAMGCCANLLALLDRCGLADQLHRYRELLFLHPDHPPSRFAPSRWLPAPFHLAGALSSLRFLSARQRRQIRRAMLKLFRTSNDRLVGQTAHQWLQSVSQDPATIRDFWDVILVSALGENPNVVSMAVARKVFVDGFAGSVGASDVLVPRQPLAELFGRRLRQAIESLGVSVVTQTAVKQLRSDPKVAIQTQNGDDIHADHVVMAVPWHATKGLLTGDLVPNAPALAAIPSSPISGLHLWFDRQFTDRYHAVMVGTISQWMFRQPWGNESDQDRMHYYQIVISASQQARQMEKNELVDSVLTEIRHSFPGARDAKLLRSRVVTDPLSVFSVRPEVEALRPAARTRVPWLHLAGDWIETGWPATMEGAVLSGRMAASSICDREGLGTIKWEDGLPRGRIARHLIQ